MFARRLSLPLERGFHQRYVCSYWFNLNQLTFERHVENVLAYADENGVLIGCVWTILIPKKRAIDYVNTYNQNSSIGFYEHESRVILTHDNGKISFSQIEGDALITLIKTAYSL
jgi:hypothetical protein